MRARFLSIVLLAAILVVLFPAGTLADGLSGKVQLSGKADPSGYSVWVKNGLSRSVVVYWRVLKQRRTGEHSVEIEEVYYNVPNGTTLPAEKVLRASSVGWQTGFNPDQSVCLFWRIEVRELPQGNVKGSLIALKQDTVVYGEPAFGVKYVNPRAVGMANGGVKIIFNAVGEAGINSYVIRGWKTGDDPLRSFPSLTKTISAEGSGRYEIIIEALPEEVTQFIISAFGDVWVKHSNIFYLK